MKLTIKRDQADVKGIFGGHKGVSFSLYAKAEITNDEQALIEHYKIGEYILASYDLPIKGSENMEFHLSVNRLTNGDKTETGSISTLLELEEKIKEGCQNLKTLLEVMKTFGGEEVIEI